jgi:hypothetical protein
MFELRREHDCIQHVRLAMSASDATLQRDCCDMSEWEEFSLMHGVWLQSFTSANKILSTELRVFRWIFTSQDESWQATQASRCKEEGYL